jgi:hypothetical protein
MIDIRGRIAKMPYIKSKRKKALNEDATPKDVGELTYMICKVCDDYIREHGLRYQVLAEVAGALSCSQQEIYRRVTSRYEDYKVMSNGDALHSVSLLTSLKRNTEDVDS